MDTGQLISKALDDTTLNNDLVYRGQGKVAVLAHKEIIVRELEKGHQKLRIWKALKDANLMPITYQSFVRHVNEHILKKDSKKGVETEKETQTHQPKKKEKKPERMAGVDEPRDTYVHNPVADMSLLDS